MEMTSQRRDRLYNIAILLSVIFGILLVTGIVVYKMNEDYFNGNARFMKLMESVSVRDEEVAQPKVNIKVKFTEGSENGLVIPLDKAIDEQDVSVHVEFDKNRYAIVLSGYADFVGEDINLIGDLDILEAAGAYSQDGDVTVEAYCNNCYGYDIIASDSGLTVSFYDVPDRYDYTVVVYTPLSEKKRFLISSFEERLLEFADECGIKLYMTMELEDEYTQEDIVDFANRIGADMLIGVDLTSALGDKSYMTGICNTEYFMPDFDSTSLCVKLMEGFSESVEYEVSGFKESDDEWPIVDNAVVPSALIRIMVADSANQYSLNEGVIEGLENTINNVVTEWRNSDNEDR